MDRILFLAKPGAEASELVRSLEREGFDVFAYSSLGAASVELAARHFDLVLLDLDLRALDLARLIRSAYPATRVALTGSCALAARQLERLDCGAVAFFSKPFDVRGAGSFVRRHLTSPMPYSRRLWHAEQPASYAV